MLLTDDVPSVGRRYVMNTRQVRGGPMSYPRPLIINPGNT